MASDVVRHGHGRGDWGNAKNESGGAGGKERQDTGPVEGHAAGAGQCRQTTRNNGIGGAAAGQVASSAFANASIL